MGGIDRRSFLKAAGGLGLLSVIPLSRLEAWAAATPGPGQAGLFLNAHQLDTLRAVTARFIPGLQEGEPDPGAREAGCAEAIDVLLASFTATSPNPPRIHAGGPWSNRDPIDPSQPGPDFFADFVPLDDQAAEGWRIRIEGPSANQGFATGVVGLQQVYRDGLAHLDERAKQLGFADFVSLPGPMQDIILSDQTDSKVQDFVSPALANTLEAMYGPPEYGGNRDLVGWTTTGWPGDSQPKGYTDQQVSQADPGDSTGALAPEQAQQALDRFLTALSGQPAPSRRWWVGRSGFEQG